MNRGVDFTQPVLLFFLFISKISQYPNFNPQFCSSCSHSYRHNISIRLRKIRQAAKTPEVRVTSNGEKSDAEVEAVEEGEVEESEGESGEEEVEDGLFQCEYCGAAFGEGLGLSASV